MPHNFLARLTGSFSQGAADNPTVAMVEAAYRHHGLDVRYINCEVHPDKLGDAVRGARAMGWLGFNCSMPHKVKVIDHLDGLGQSAAVMGAVNCAVMRDGKLIGENTDGKGFLQSLRQVVDPEGKSIVMFGAGGAARAIAVELAFAGAKKILIVNRDDKRGRDLADLLNSKTKITASNTSLSGSNAAGSGGVRVPDGTDIVVNATSIGLYPDVDAQVPLSIDSLKPSMVIADVIVNPPRTNLIRDAQARGCKVIDGLGMVVNQGVIGIKYWTGVDVDAGVMRKTVEALFAA